MAAAAAAEFGRAVQHGYQGVTSLCNAALGFSRQATMGSLKQPSSLNTPGSSMHAKQHLFCMATSVPLLGHLHGLLIYVCST